MSELKDGEGSFRAKLPPIAEGVDRPLWSVMIPTYNCANYLRETLASVLVQDPGPDLMQIEVVDDCSTRDDPEAVVREFGLGRVGFFRRPENGGHIQNFQTCLERSRGHLVHLLHGDDCVRSGFYQELQAAFEERPDLGAAFCRHIYVDDRSHWQGISSLEQPESGPLDDWLERIALGQRIQTPSIVVRREVYETLGMFDQRLASGEDWEMWVRIAANYPFWYETEPLALYRVHQSSNTARHTGTGQTLRDIRLAIEIIQPYLPASIAAGVAKRSSEHFALEAIRYGVPDILDRGEFAVAVVQLREALKCSHSPRVLLHTLLATGRLGKRWAQRWQHRLQKLASALRA